MTEQLKEQVELYKTTVTKVKVDEENFKHRHAQQIAKLKKEQQSSFDVIKLLKEANQQMEENFIQHQKIISTMEQELEKTQADNKELKEQIDILKIKLPKLLKAGLSSNNK